MKPIAAMVVMLVIVVIALWSTWSTSMPAQKTSLDQYALAHLGILPIDEIDDQTFVFTAKEPGAEPRLTSSVVSP